MVMFTALFFSSCEMYNLDINEDPNNPVQAELGLLMPSIQVNLAYNYQTIHNYGQGVMGLTSGYDGLDYDESTFNGLWNSLYLNTIKDLEEYIIVASKTDGKGDILLPHSLGAGQVLKSFIYSTMVDLWGDIPYSEASLGNNLQFNPKYDDQVAIYQNCLSLIDEAIANLSGPGLSIGGDFFYNGNSGKWLKAAKSLKLKLLVQVRRAPGFTYGSGINSEIASLLVEDDLINSMSDDMQFIYTTDIARGQRHPWMTSVYSGDNSFSYLMHQFMFEMLIKHDPRIPYYFKRQTSSVLDQEDDTQKNTTPCSQNSFCEYGYLVLNQQRLNELATAGVISSPIPTSTEANYLAGFFGRDKGDPSGIPLDGALRTAPGVYPMGGQFDIGSPGKINSKDGVGLGNGVTMFLTKGMVDLYKMEAILETGATGDARVIFEDFLDYSFSKVETFSTSISASGAVSMDKVATDTDHTHVTDVATYIADRLGEYDIASNKLSVIYKEAWFALFGSGFELYNNFRRTGYPDDIQIPTFRYASSGQRDFPIRIPYTIDELNLNENLTKIIPSDGTEGVFWDVIKYKFPI